MKYLITLSLLLMLSNTMWSQNTWLKVIGGGGNDWGYSITRIEEENILITGFTDSLDGDFKGMYRSDGLHPSEGRQDIVVIKLNKDGDVLWKRIFGGTRKEGGGDITTTASGDGILITGYTSSNDGVFYEMKKGRDTSSYDIFVMKLDKDGRILWKKTFGGSKDESGVSVTTESDSSILITGKTSSNDKDFKGMIQGEDDIFVIKLDKDGEILWKKTFGGPDWEHVFSFTTTSDGGILITGITDSNDGDFVGMNSGKDDIFIIKLDKDGRVLWKRTYGGSENDWGRSLSNTPDGGVLITGDFSSDDGDFKGMNKGKTDIFVIKLDKDGEILWKKTFGGDEVDVGSHITSTSDGDILITGWSMSNDGDFRGMNEDESDIYVMKLDGDGKVLWKRSFGGDESEGGYSLTTTDNSILVTGMTKSNDGVFKRLAKSRTDIFIMKLDSNGNLEPTDK